MPSGGMTLADIVHQALRREAGPRWRAAAIRLEDALAQRQQRLRVRDLALDAVREEPQRRTKIADDLGLREVDLLDMRRLIADMDHLRPAPAP